MNHVREEVRMDWVKRIRLGWIVSKEESGMHRVKKD